MSSRWTNLSDMNDIDGYLTFSDLLHVTVWLFGRQARRQPHRTKPIIAEEA